MTSEPIKFLLVDDTAENLVALEPLLRRDGLELLVARSGSEALELLLKHEVSLALLDVQMPVMDGFELAELMRGAKRTKHVPIIFVTAGSRDPQRVFKGYETGAVDFLFKPLDAQILKGKCDVFFELHRQKIELAGALRLNEMFVGILGHDLRNPLGAIVTSAQLLEQTVGDERQLRSVQRISRAADRMREMIEQLLDLTRARLTSGLGLAREHARVDLVELVRRTIDELHGGYPNREVRVEASGDCVTAGDPARLLQLLSNLIANALRHGTSGTRVTVGLDGGAADIVVQVRNRGAIPATALPTLFDPFQRRPGRTSSSGLGLGLFIARQIALAHDGDITVASTEETGTIVSVRLPRETARTSDGDGDVRERAAR